MASVAFRPDGRFAYATLHGENKVAVIDTATMAMVKTLPAGDQPFGLIVMPRPSKPQRARPSAPRSRPRKSTY